MGIFERELGKMHQNFASSCHNLANIYWYTGQYEKAETRYIESMHIRERILGKDHPDYAESCNDLANLYGDLEQFKKAEQLYLLAIQIRETALGKDHPEYAESCNNLAILYAGISNYKKAESLFISSKQNSKKIFGKDSHDYAVSCTNLASLYMDMDTMPYQRSASLYLEAKAILQNLLGEEHPDYASVCQNIGRLYLLSGSYQKAEPLLLQALKVREKSLVKEHFDYTESCINLATLYSQTQNLEKAHKLFEDAFISQGRQQQKIFEFTTEVEKQSFLKKITAWENSIYSFYLTVYNHEKQSLTYNLSLSNRNSILTSYRKLRRTINASIDTVLKNKYAEWINLREQLSFWYTQPVDERPDYAASLESLANQLEKDLIVRSSAFQQNLYKDSLTWRMVQQNLQFNEAAIEFVKFDLQSGAKKTDSTYYIALILTKNLLQPHLVPLFEEKQLARLLRAGNSFNTIVSIYGRSEKPQTAYNLIWGRLEPFLKRVDKIYFAPAGLLYRVSFAAIPINEKLVLSDKYELVQLNTTAVVVDKKDIHIDHGSKIQLYGGVQYDADSTTIRQSLIASHNNNLEGIRFLSEGFTDNPGWKYLPGTEKEINDISLLGSDKYAIAAASGVIASEESIKALSGLSSPALLHIASHGFFFPDPSKMKKTGKQSGEVFRGSQNVLLRAGLLFAGANNAWKGKPVEGLEDGILTAYEVSNLYLPNTKLAVLSACETGLGEVHGNEGVYGLQRAFKMAGVEYLLMSLWKVPDEATAEFMKGFYKGIFDHQSVQDAFFSAQSSLKSKYRNEPYKWAAWILVR
jgi:CHAT domain-containing protein